MIRCETNYSVFQYCVIIFIVHTVHRQLTHKEIICGVRPELCFRVVFFLQQRLGFVEERAIAEFSVVMLVCFVHVWLVD